MLLNDYSTGIVRCGASVSHNKAQKRTRANTTGQTDKQIRRRKQHQYDARSRSQGWWGWERSQPAMLLLCRMMHLASQNLKTACGISIFAEVGELPYQIHALGAAGEQVWRRLANTIWCQTPLGALGVEGYQWSSPATFAGSEMGG